MKLDGIHHITAITADRARCIAFYAGVLGLNVLEETPDGDQGDDGRLHFGDARGRPGSIFSFFVVPGAQGGAAGAGMVHRIRSRVSDLGALGFWSGRLSDAGHDAELVEAPRGVPALRFRDPEGLEHELVPDFSRDEPLVARSESIPPAYALCGFGGVRSYCRTPGPTADLLAGRLSFAGSDPGTYWIAGPRRTAYYSCDEPPPERGVQGAGTVHHVAWTCEEEDQTAWRQRVIGLGARVTPILERERSRSIYFREPSGVLFEIATRAPGRAAEPGDDGAWARETTELSLPTAA
jgi:glyoxalase family protein